ncbi:glutathione synthase, partial [Phenoliferia sp. Uapishka_3]
MSTWPPSLTDSAQSSLLSLAADYSLSHGLIYRPPASTPSSTPSTTSSIHAPYSLFPAKFPSHLFHKAIALQPLYNALYSHVTVDDAFLEDVLGGAVSKVDEFQGRLLELWKQVRQEGIKQPLHLGLFRSDYLLHSPPGCAPDKVTIKQVEFNTISSSFGPLATKVGDLHRYLQASGAYPEHEDLALENLPVNRALAGLAAGLAAGHKAYSNPSAKILMVVQDNERNAFDQRALEWELLETFVLSLLPSLPLFTKPSHLSSTTATPSPSSESPSPLSTSTPLSTPPPPLS